MSLVKNIIGGDGSLDFVTTMPGQGTNITTSGGTGSISASNVPAGTYSIFETVPADWQLVSATCSDGNPPNAVAVSEGETVTCTFTNTKLVTVIVEKQTLPNGSPQTFRFMGDVAGTIGDGGQIALGNLLPGTYTSTETPAEGWALTSIVCDDGNSTGDTGTGQATFNLEAGETVRTDHRAFQAGGGGARRNQDTLALVDPHHEVARILGRRCRHSLSNKPLIKDVTCAFLDLL